MKTREIIKYAQENGFNSVKFILKRGEQKLAAGKFLDAYLEFVQIPILGDVFVTISQLEQELGDDIEFEVLTDEEYITYNRLIFLLQGKELPKEFAFDSEESRYWQIKIMDCITSFFHRKAVSRDEWLYNTKLRDYFRKTEKRFDGVNGFEFVKCFFEQDYFDVIQIFNRIIERLENIEKGGE